MRALTADELRLVAGGYSEQQGDYNPGDVYVYGTGYDPYNPNYDDQNPDDPDDSGGGDGGGGDPGWQDLTDQVTGLNPVDNAVYVVPEGITSEYLIAAMNFLRDIADPVQKLIQFKAMYENPAHPHFLDFKEFAGPQVTYFSDAAGRSITSSAFEPFGNFLYGFIGYLGGISPDILRGAAAVMQEGQGGLMTRFLNGEMVDAPEDIPHVEAGMAAAAQFTLLPSSTGFVFGITQD